MKCKFNFLVLINFFFSFFSISNAQSIQKIKVLEYLGEDGKRPLPQVEICVGNAATVMSDENGFCTLEFRSLKPGDKVLVRHIYKPEYVVFNRNIIDGWYITEEDGDVLTLVMCKQKLIMDLREKYRQAAVTKLKKEYKGREDLFEYQEKLEELDDIVEKFVYIDLNEANTFEKNVIKQISEGNVAGAVEVYDTENLVETLIKERQSLENLTNQAETIKLKKAESVVLRDKSYEQVKRHVALLRFQGGQNNIDRSVRLLHDIAYIDTTNYTVLLDYANYCSKMNNYSEATAALSFCKNSPDTIVRIQAYIVQGQINSRLQLHKKSVDMLELSCKHLRKKSEERNAPTLYLAERVKVLLGLVSTYNSLRDSVGAFTNRKELLDLSHQLFEQKKDNESKRILVEALYYSHYCHFLFGKDYASQLDGFAEAIKLQEELYADDPVGQGAMLAFLYSARAYTYEYKDKDYVKVVQERRRAIDIYEEVYNKNPKAYVGYLGSEYRILADIYIENIKNEIDQALPLLQKAEYYIMEELQMSPEVSKSHYASINNSYAKFYYTKKDYAKCEPYAEKAFDEFYKIYENSPKAYSNYLKDLYPIILDCLNQEPDKNAARIAMYKKFAAEKGLR